MKGNTPENNKNRPMVILFVLIVLFTCLAIYTSYTQMSTVGPTALALSSNNNVVVALSDRFIVLKHNGVIESEVKFDQLGVKGLVREMQGLESGGFIIGDSGHRQLFKCSENFSACLALKQGIDNASYNIGKYHKFYVDEANKEIVLTHTERHELILLDIKGSFIKTLVTKGDFLKFPDGVYPLNHQQILLANSLNKQVIHLDYSGEKTIITNRYNIDNQYAYEGKSLPIEISKTSNGFWWVATQDESLKDNIGSVLSFDENWKPTGRLMHAGLEQPIDILGLGEWMLIADMESFSLLAFDQEGTLLNRFGEPRLYEILDRQRTIKEVNEILRYVSIACLLLLLAVALVLENRRKKSEANERAHLTKEAVDSLIIKVPGTYGSMMRLMPVVLIVLLASSGYLLYGSSPKLVISLGPMMVAWMIVCIVMLRIIVRHIPAAIEVNSGVISISLADDEKITAMVSDISYTDKALIIGENYYFIGKNGAFIGGNDKYKLLIGLLKQAKKIKEGKFQLFMLRKEKFNYFLLVISLLFVLVSSYVLDTGEEEKKEAETIRDVLF